jgi:hypothetical protein
MLLHYKDKPINAVYGHNIFYSENRMKRINTLCVKTRKCLNARAGGRRFNIATCKRVSDL